MEYDGLAVRYPVNRKLTEEEEGKRVEPSVRTSWPPKDFGLIVEHNILCLEVCDKYYAFRGFVTAIFLAPLVYFVYATLVSLPDSWLEGMSKTPPEGAWKAWAAGAFGLVCLILMVAGSAWAVLRESFTLTHYPIRFNRNNRMVYVFRPKRRADILRVKWGDVYWHIRHNKNKMFGGYNWFVAGHVMDKDRKTVRETFAFGHVATSPEEVYPQWEYVRRFMQDGPDAVPQAKYQLPIAGRKEGFWWGAQTLLLNSPPAGMFGTILLLPFLTPAVFTRWLCMMTNRVPRWPDDIEAECAAQEQRPPLKLARPEYAKLVALLVVGIAVDAALLAWLYFALWGK